MKNGTYLIIFEERKSVKTCSIAFYVNGDNVRYFDILILKLKLNTLQKKFKNSWATKISRQIFTKYKPSIQQFVDTFQ